MKEALNAPFEALKVGAKFNYEVGKAVTKSFQRSELAQVLRIKRNRAIHKILKNDTLTIFAITFLNELEGIEEETEAA